MLNWRKVFKKVTPYALGKAMNISLSTVYSWKKTEIPLWRIAAIQEACYKMGIDISDCYEAEEKSE